MYLSALCCILGALLFFVSPSVLFGKPAPAAIYTYRETVGEKITSFSWQVQEKAQQRIISVHEKKKSFTNICTTDGSTLQWRLKDPDQKSDIVASRQGNSLKISGTRNGEIYTQTVELDSRPWYQPLSYSLKDFLGSERQSMSFWIVRADTVDVIALEVEKKGEEEITVNEQTIPALKVEVRAEGFYSHFWHGTYWYRKSDKLFLMYRSVQGMPGSAETVVELTGEPGQPDKF